MNILIVKLSAVGDVIHTLPSLAVLRRCYPDADIAWVVEEAAADLLAGHPDLNRVIVSGRKRWIKELRRGRIIAPLREMISFIRDLRRRRYDLVIDFHGLLKSAVIVLLSGGKRKLGYNSLQELSGLFYNEKIPEEMGKHAVDRYLDFVRHVAGKSGAACLAATPEFRIAIGEKERRRTEALLKEQAAEFSSEKDDDLIISRQIVTPAPASARVNSAEVQNSSYPMDSRFRGNDKEYQYPPLSEVVNDRPRFVAVNPVAFWETKLWEEEKFAELCDRLREERGIGIVLTGGESAPLERICRKMRTKAVNLGGRTTLRELACIYREAALLITTDSGPMHLAAAVGTPVVALFGPTDPARTGPWGPGHRIIRKGLSCSPCFRKRCETPRCMTDISVEEVFTAVKEMLAGKE
ncbi:MAG: glycosyltransferase family 9 protein [Deltaproteobacteria bacterium]|nr:glycosyltransferase family 9 protein [Deltaproteobacteria bacterium]